MSAEPLIPPPTITDLEILKNGVWVPATASQLTINTYFRSAGNAAQVFKVAKDNYLGPLGLIQIEVIST